MSQQASEGIRRTPSQDRSTQRFELILDTAAHLIDEVGYAQLTPSLIARSAGMSGPGMYRYFADLEAILNELAKRIRARFITRVAEMLADQSLAWEDGIAGAIEIYADMYRHEPAFRAFRLQGGPHLPPESASRDTAIIATATIAHFQPRYKTWERPRLQEHVEVMIEIIQSLVRRAFDAETPDTFEFFISEAKRISIGYLGDYLEREPGTEPAQHAVRESEDA